MLAILGTLLSGLFGKSATVLYPVAPAKPAPFARGHVGIDIDSCIFCGICRRKCPTEAIDVSKDEKTWSIEPFRCIQCNCCVEVCPKKCLIMHSESTPVSIEMTKDVVHARISPDTADH